MKMRDTFHRTILVHAIFLFAVVLLPPLIAGCASDASKGEVVAPAAVINPWCINNGICDRPFETADNCVDCIDQIDCGDGYCEGPETSTNCPADCESYGPVCGNGFCELAETEASCPADCLDAPSNVRLPAADNGFGKYTLHWSAPAGLVEYYTVREVAIGGHPTCLKQNTTNTSLSFGDHAAGVYIYSIHACNAGGCGPAAKSSKILVRLPAELPAGPYVPYMSNSGRYPVSWSMSPNAKSYTLVRDGSVRYSGVARGVDERQVVDGIFTYAVEACNVNGCSGLTTSRSIDVTLTVDGVVDDATPVALPVPTHDETVGALPGEAGVNNGAATYTIPIEVPPGRRGMQPELDLVYNSRNGDSFAGRGWGLSGLSRIRRCPSTMAQDEFTLGIAFELSDPLCLDGQRLVLVDGTHGKPGAEYRTEVDSFASITLENATTSQRTSYFKVERKSNIVQYYGYDPRENDDSNVLVPDADPGVPAIPSQWMLRREVDPQGNSVVYDFDRYGTELLLHSIEYTGRDEDETTTRGDRRVVFSYGARGDPRIAWAAKRYALSTVALRLIEIWVGSTEVGNYQLGYAESAATQRDLLTSVTRCKGNMCLPPTEFTYQGETEVPFFTSESLEIPENSACDGPNYETEIVLMNDFDGDGTRDKLYLDWEHLPDFGGRVPCARRLHLSHQGNVEDITTFPAFAERDQSEYVNWPSDRNVDIDRDGRADLYGRQADGTFVISSWNGTDWTLKLSNLVLPADARIGRIVDLNADSKPDLLMRSQTKQIVYMQGDSSLPDLEFNPTPVEIPVPTHLSIKEIFDADGNGLPDFYLDRTPYHGVNAQIVFMHHGSAGPKPEPVELANIGGPSTLVSTVSTGKRQGMGFADVNGDGLKDIYKLASDGTRLWINHGGQFGEVTLTGGAISMPSDLRFRAFPMDYDADGAEEVLIPRTMTSAYCQIVGCGDQVKEHCTNGFFPGSLEDRSIYLWDAIEFRHLNSDSRAVELRQTGIEAAVHSANPNDFFGDGLTDVESRTRIHYRMCNNFDEPRISSRYAPYYQSGHHVRRNWGVDPGQAPDSSGQAPDLLSSAEDGFTSGSATVSRARWEYRPLSEDNPDVGCSGLSDLYDVDTSLPRPEGAVPFTSSMRVVARFDAPNGIGGMNGTCYGYETAMFGRTGRGFLGFRKIIAQEEIDDGAPYPNQRNKRTVTTFEQGFPCTGRVVGTRLGLAGDISTQEPLQYTQNTWECVDRTVQGIESVDIEDDFGVHRPYLAETAQVTWGLWDREQNMPPLSVSSTTFSFGTDPGSPATTALNQLYGNVALVSKLETDGTVCHKSVDQTYFDYTNEAEWWVDKPTKRIATTTVKYNSPPLPGLTWPQLIAECSQELAAGHDDHNLVTTDYEWYPASEESSHRRLTKRETVQPLGGTADGCRINLGQGLVAPLSECHSAAVTAYDSYGNPTSVETDGGGVETPRTSTMTYTTDGYFVETTTNAMGHVKTIGTDARFGVVETANEYGVTVTNTHDSFGRQTSSATVGPWGGSLPVTWTARQSCDGGDCPVFAAYRTVVVRDGAPIVTTYVDLLDRTIESRRTGFATGSTRPLVASGVDYNARGWVMRETKPHFLGGEQFATEYSWYDALGRPGRSTRDWSDHCAADPQALCQFVAAYDYAGMTTTVTLPPNIHINEAENLLVSRTQNVLGQLVKSVNAAGGITTYSYDAAGKPVRITGVEGATIAGDYDDLGRPNWIDDPDRGKWNFVHNGLGELVQQTDAVGNVIQQNYDSLGRMVGRRVTRPQDTVSAVESEWIFDAPVPGELNAEIGYDLDNGAVVLHRAFAYDGLHRPRRTHTCIDDAGTCSGDAVFDVELAYDRYTGQVKGTKLPSGEIVAYDHDAYGYSTAERNPLAPVADDIYRTALAMNAQGHVTREHFSNGLDAEMDYFASTGKMNSVCITAGDCVTPLYRTDYRYADNYLNLTERTANLDPLDDIALRYKREAFEYDDLHRLTDSARTWGGMAISTQPITYIYSAAGNLLSKSDYAEEYGYGAQIRSTDNAGPHAVAWVRKPGEIDPVLFAYDLNGNLTQADGKLLKYGIRNKPVHIQNDTGEVTELFYGPNGERYKQVFTGPGVNRTTYYAGKLHERVVENDVRTDKDYVGDYLIISDEHGDPAGRQLRYLHRDRLGSIEMMTDQSGQPVNGEGRNFDAFGKPRDGIWRDSGGDLNPLATTRGFTAHEHLNDHQLIHMNGRAYDYNLGRFLSVDPVIQFPENSQSLNPYSYIMNNPLSGTDPTGYSQDDPKANKYGQGFTQNWRTTFNRNSGEKAYLVTAKYKSGKVKQFILTQDAVDHLASIGSSNSAVPPTDIESPSDTGKTSARGSGSGGGSDPYDTSRWVAFHDSFGNASLERAAGMLWGLPVQSREEAIEQSRHESYGAGIGALGALAAAGGPAAAELVRAMVTRVIGLGAATVAVLNQQCQRCGPPAARILVRKPHSLQKFFGKHGKDFGLTGNWNPSRAADASRAIHQHINSPGVSQIPGRYLGNDVIHNLNLRTGLNIIEDTSANFISGWKLSPEQLESVLNTGRLF